MAYNDEGHQDISKHPHAPAGSPTGGQFTSNGGGGTKKPPTPTRPAAKPAPAAKPQQPQQVVTAPPEPTGPLKDLKAGADNDPARVKQLQALIHDLRLAPLNVDGQYGDDTAAAVKAIQQKLGMKPTGRASASLVRRLADAHRLSPCVGKPVAASALVLDLEPEAADDPVRVLAAAVGRLELTRWSDDTVWLGDDIELDLDEAMSAAVDEWPDWLTVESTEDGLVLEAEGSRFEVLGDFVDEFRQELKVLAAAGHDTTPGHDELHHYWTKNPEGLAKWADSPMPWTTLVAHLSKHVSPEKAKVFASRWFIEVFGYAAGSDLNRVTHGHPPRGDRVGPG